MSHDKEWVCAPSADCDIWKSTEYFETKEAAIEAGKKVISQWNQGNTDTEIEDILGDWFKEDVKIVSFAVGQCFSPSLDIDAGDILEGIAEGVYDQCGDVAEDYLDDVLEEHKSELESLIINWFEKYKYYPTCYSVGNIETIMVLEGDNEKMSDLR
ncbi:hypothetical protein ACE4Z8_07795 [Enterococcus avium]|jgi:hypothetical protein|uniref:hypothetical protein n=1 Tax=Enterococcus avium TaxID=33945 RepID=UPI0035CC5601